MIVGLEHEIKFDIAEFLFGGDHVGGQGVRAAISGSECLH